MKFIPEESINTAIEQLNNEDEYILALKTMSEEQPDLDNFLDQENYSLLTKDEMALLTYLSVIIYVSVKTVINKNLKISGKILENFEEENWEVFNASGAKSFSAVLDIFFQQYHQEDLLALVEDVIQADEEQVVSSVGAEIIFVACKSIIDTLNKLN